MVLFTVGVPPGAIHGRSGAVIVFRRSRHSILIPAVDLIAAVIQRLLAGSAKGQLCCRVRIEDIVACGSSAVIADHSPIEVQHRRGIIAAASQSGSRIAFKGSVNVHFRSICGNCAAPGRFVVCQHGVPDVQNALPLNMDGAAHHRCGIFLHSGRIAFQSNPGSHAGSRAAIGSFILFKGTVCDVQFPMVTVNGAAHGTG